MKPRAVMRQTPPDRATRNHSASRMERFMMQGGIVITLLIIALIAISIAEPRFLNWLNLINLSRNFSFLAIPALAQMLVMTAGGFDLSVGAVVALSSVVTATVMAAAQAVFPGMDMAVIFLALAAALATGALIGIVNAALIAVFSLSPFMVTLAVTSVLMGLVLFHTQGIPVYGVPDGFVDGLGRGQFLGLPPVLYAALAVVALMIVVQRLTRLGRHIYAVGSDARSARLSGVSTRRTLFIAYTLAGVLSALTGFLMTARLGFGQGTIGNTLALETIAAAVIGGVSLRGGSGRAEHVALAALFLVLIANMMNLLQVDSRFQMLVLGAVLIAALALERLVLRGRRHA